MTTADISHRDFAREKSVTTMYEMYPEDWGPARHRDEAAEAIQTAIDLRDNGGEPPEDN